VRSRGATTPSQRLLGLPDEGTLLVCTDLHGHLADFRRMRELFLAADAAGERPFLLFTGDLIHGPNCEPEDWPDFLGAHYVDQSGDLVDEYLALVARHPARVSCLIGNHEHSHIGGPHTPKFWSDETVHFEQTVGPERTERYKRLFCSMPVVAVASCGVAVTHAAPAVEIGGPQDIEQIRYEGYEKLAVQCMPEMQLLGGLLWSRCCPPETARRFLDALAIAGAGLDIVVYGHEIVAEGFERVGDEQLVLSTSFGIRQEHKHYLRIDLSRRYRSVRELRVGEELRPLY
jgi:hypothetical protein